MLTRCLFLHHMIVHGRLPYIYEHNLESFGITKLKVLVKIMTWTGDGMLVGFMAGWTTNTRIHGEVYMDQRCLTPICQWSILFHLDPSWSILIYLDPYQSMLIHLDPRSILIQLRKLISEFVAHPRTRGRLPNHHQIATTSYIMWPIQSY